MNSTITIIAALLPNAYQLVAGIKTSLGLAQGFADAARTSGGGEDRAVNIRLQRSYEGQADGMLRAALIIAGADVSDDDRAEALEFITRTPHSELRELIEEANA